jgi:hypothetical protein
MKHAPSGHRIRLISQGYDTWRVQVLFSDRDLTAHEVSVRLQEVKRELARRFGVPDHLLEYSRLISRQMTRGGLLVQMQIIKQELPSRPPVFRAKPLRSEDGTLLSDMMIEGDLYPYDEFDHRLTRLVVEARLKAMGFDLSCVDWEPVMEALAEMERTNEPVTGLVIGQGVMPGLGKSSRVTYGIRHDQEAFLSSAWMGLRPVQKGEFLVEVSVPASSHQWGRNVYGRELEPRPGLQTRLEAGEGTQLWLHGTQLVAQRDGLLYFERSGRDKRDWDTRNMLLAKLVGHVLAAKVFPESQVFDLELAEPAMILGSVGSGSRLRTRAPLFIAGDVEEHSTVESTDSLRVAGGVRGAQIKVARQCCISGFVADSSVECGLALQIDSGVLNSNLRATDIEGREIRGSKVEALRQTTFDRVDQDGGEATAIRINLHRFLESQQSAGRAAIDDLQRSLVRIQDLFGVDITLQVTEATAQRMLLHWLREQKAAGGGNYTHIEVQELRSILEMVPLIRQQLDAMGMEIRDISAQLEACDSAAPSSAEDGADSGSSA